MQPRREGAMTGRVSAEDSSFGGRHNDSTRGAEDASSDIRSQWSGSRDRSVHSVRQQRGRWQTVTGGVDAVTHSTERFDTKPIVVSRDIRGNMDSSVLSSSSSVCSTNDFLSVERDFKELLEGYRSIVGSGFEDRTFGSNSSLNDFAPGRVNCDAHAVKGTSNRKGSGCEDSVGNNPVRDRESGGGYEEMSLPVSSVRGDHSTETDTPTLVQLPAGVSPTPAQVNAGGVWVSTLSEAACNQVLPERVSSPVDIFADVLTEDQLSRSLEAQNQERQQRIGFLRQQRGDAIIPQQDRKAASPARQLSWNSTLLVDTVDNSNEVDNSRGVGFEAVWYPSRGDMRCVPTSPTPRQRFAIASGGCRAKVDRSNYSGRLAALPQWQESDASPIGRFALTSRYDASSQFQNQPGSSSPGKHEALDNLEGHLTPEETGHYTCVLGRGEGGSFLWSKREGQVWRRFLHSGQRKGGDSITPEIATTTRRTENHSLRSGAMPLGENRAGDALQMSADWRHGARFGTWEVGVDVGGRVEKIAEVGNGGGPAKFEDTQQQSQLHQQQRPLYHSGGCRYSLSGRSVVTRFHENVERYMAAVESNNRFAADLPHFADSLVGAAISDLFPAVKRRQAQLKQSQHAAAGASRVARGAYYW